MAIHFRRTTKHSGGAGNVIDGGGGMPYGCYYGFALGPESVISRVRVTCRDELLLGPGMVVPVEPFEGAPAIECVELLDASDFAAPVHVIGLTHCHELALPAPRRLAFDARIASSLDGANPTELFLPFGRRHALITAYGNSANTLVIAGGTTGIDVATHEVDLTPAPLPFTGNLIGYHVGGTDHEEPWPFLKLTVDGPDAGVFEVHYHAFGEPGD